MRIDYHTDDAGYVWAIVSLAGGRYDHRFLGRRGHTHPAVLARRITDMYASLVGVGVYQALAEIYQQRFCERA